MQYKGHKMIYILLGIFGILIAFFMIKGCAYPTSYRAFIPKALDSEYKEYERLCKEEIGKVVYARPVREGVKLEDIHLAFPSAFLVSHSIKLEIVSVSDGESIKYIYIQGFEYYNSWVTPSLSMHQDVKQHIQCKPFKDLKEEYAIIENIAFNNKEYIGDEMIVKERRKLNRMGYATSQKYISQVFKEAINAKSHHYIDLKESQ